MTAKQGEEELAATLRGLVHVDGARSETARLRDVFDDVEAALRAGVKRKAVLAALHAKGFQMTMESFKSALRRIRQERNET